MSATVKLANKTFTIGTTLADKARRSDYVRDLSLTLSKEEQAVLKAVGVGEDMEARLRPYMPDFFDALPDCQTDTSLYLHKKCEVPYYVLWSSMFADRLSTEKRIASGKTKPMSDLDAAMTESMVKGLASTPSKVDEIFTLLLKHPAVDNVTSNARNTSGSDPITSIFTLRMM